MITAPYLIAAVQMVAAASVDENLAAIDDHVATAAARGARLVALPENAAIMGRNEYDKVRVREPLNAGPIQTRLGALAARHKVWLVAGTIPLTASIPNKVRAGCVVFDDRGATVACYEKMHLFSFSQGDERYAEGNSIEAGDKPLAIDSPLGRLALSVCYDVRFPELYRGLAPFDVMFGPSAFTVTTGRAHWEILLRARAIENQCYVVAPAQGGRHESGRETYGHTMIIDPWGTVLAVQARDPGVVIASIDPAVLQRVRANLPALTHRVL